MNEQNLLSNQEIHELGINIVVDDIRKQGFSILAVTTDITKNPQIIATANCRKVFVAVRTAVYPKRGMFENFKIASNIIKESVFERAACYFASVGIANANGVTDLEMSIPTKGSGFYVSYDGLVELNLANIKSFLPPNESVTFNRDGQIAGSTRRLHDGRNTIVANANADVSSLLMSICQIIADDLNDEQKEVFSRWAGLPVSIWSQDHRDTFALALMHFLMEEKEIKENLPERLRTALNTFPPQALKQLKRPLSSEIRKLCASLFGA